MHSGIPNEQKSRKTTYNLKTYKTGTSRSTFESKEERKSPDMYSTPSDDIYLLNNQPNLSLSYAMVTSNMAKCVFVHAQLPITWKIPLRKLVTNHMIQ